MVVMTTVANATKEDELIEYGRDFSIIHRYSRMYMSRAMEDYGIPGRLIPYVMVICEEPGMTQEAIARKFHIDKGSVARTVAKLVDKGLVIRKLNPENKRENLIYPTEDMLVLSETVRRTSRELDEVLNSGLSAGEQELVKDALRKMTDNLLDAMGKEECLHDKDH